MVGDFSQNKNPASDPNLSILITMSKHELAVHGGYAGLQKNFQVQKTRKTFGTSFFAPEHF